MIAALQGLPLRFINARKVPLCNAAGTLPRFAQGGKFRAIQDCFVSGVEQWRGIDDPQGRVVAAWRFT